VTASRVPVTVLMPVYNAERYLRDAIESVLCQSWRDLELLIVDDGSTDGSRGIIEAAAGRDPRVRALFRPHRGLIDTLNAGLEEARGTWVARMDADDICLPDRLQTQVAFASRHPGVAVVGTYAWYLGEGGRILGVYRLGPTTPEELARIVERDELIQMIHPTVMMDRRAVLAAGGYDARFRHVEDMELYNRLAERGHLLLAVPVPQLLYRVHGGSVAMRNHREMFRMARYARAVVLARRRGEAPPTHERFAAEQRGQSWIRRAWIARADLGAYFYRRAGVDLGRGHSMRSAAWGGLAVLLAPEHVLTRLRRQVHGGIVLPASSGSYLDRFHGALDPLEEAAALASHSVEVVSVRTAWRPRPWLTGWAEKAGKAVVYLRAHLRLAWDLWRRRHRELLIVREFITLATLAVWPLLWPLRRRVFFLVNHNLQEASQRAPERVALRFLCRTGMRVACLETAEVFEDVGIALAPDRVLVLPTPIAARRPVGTGPGRRGRAVPVVGVVGALRAEKGAEELLERLLELRERGALQARLALGCPDLAERVGWHLRGFELLDTSSKEAYEAALAACDVVLLNYRKDRYFRRPSGVVADAVSQGTVVVCPDFPIMRRQVMVPARIGCLVESRAELGAAVREALALSASPGDAFERHARARGPEALSRLMDEFVERALGRRLSRPTPSST
jgi:glycosyltransferase involved in cell wall biosynthesis